MNTNRFDVMVTRYFNSLPTNYNSWTQLLFDLDLIGLVHFSGSQAGLKQIVIDLATCTLSRFKQAGIIELDIDFFKARLFEEFFEQTAITKSTVGTMRAMAFTHPDQSPFFDQNFKIALREIMRLGKSVSRARSDEFRVIGRP